jgi:hypothetical protein
MFSIFDTFLKYLAIMDQECIIYRRIRSHFAPEHVIPAAIGMENGYLRSSGEGPLYPAFNTKFIF